MQIEKIEKKEEKATEKQVNDMFRAIILGQDITEVIHTSKGDFKIKFPRVKDIEEIGRLTAYRLNGVPARCFDNNTYGLMQYVATLDVIVLSGPSWYELAKKENPNFSWRDIPSQSFIQEVYALAYEFRAKVEEQIDGNPDTADNKMDNDGDSNAVSQPGLFEGLSGSSGTNGR